MHITSESTGMFEVCRHGNCSKAMVHVYLEKHRESDVITAIFEGAPVHVTQHRRNTIIWGVIVADLPCSPSLDHFYLMNVFLCIRAPQGGGILNLKPNKGEQMFYRLIL